MRPGVAAVEAGGPPTAAAARRDARGDGNAGRTSPSDPWLGAPPRPCRRPSGSVPRRCRPAGRRASRCTGPSTTLIPASSAMVSASSGLNCASAKTAFAPDARIASIRSATSPAPGSWPGTPITEPTISSPYALAKYGNASWNETSFRLLRRDRRDLLAHPAVELGQALGVPSSWSCRHRRWRDRSGPARRRSGPRSGWRCARPSRGAD